MKPRPKVWRALRLEPELIASIEDQADRREITFSQLVRDTLREKFGLLKVVERDGRNRTYREAARRGSRKVARNWKVSRVEG